MSISLLHNKELTLGTLTVAAGLANAYLWKGVIFSGRLQEAAGYTLPVAALLALAVFFALSSAFIRERWLRGATAVLAVLPSYLFLPASGAVLGAAAVSAGAAWYAADAIANEYAASSNFSARKIFRGGLPVFFTAVALVLAAFSYASREGQPPGKLLPRQLFDAILPFFTGTIEPTLPGYRADQTVDEFIVQANRQKVGGLVDVLNLLPRVRNQLLERERQELGGRFGLELRGNERIGDVLYQAVSTQLERIVAPYRQYLPFAAAAAFFLAVKTLTLPVYWASLILVWAVVKLLLAAGILKKDILTVQVEKITL